MVPLQPEVLEKLPKVQPEALLFPNQQSRKRPVRPESVHLVLAKALKALGVADAENVDLHSFRRAWVTTATREGVTERMAVSTDEAWDVPGAEKGLEPDRTRKPEIVWKELVNQRLDMSEVNKRWLDEYKKKYNLK